MIQHSSPFYSLLVTYLPRLQRYARGGIARRVYSGLCSLWQSDGPPVRTTLHGFNILLNRGNSYPFILEASPNFNAPLVQLVQQMSLQRPGLTFLDVGAAAGDTVLLIQERCPGAVGRFLCVEGDVEFHGLLVENMRQFQNVAVINSLLAREPMQIRSLIKQHGGTASATGDGVVNAVPLDSVDAIRAAQIDILKIDVDGFDGEVLAGATETLRRCRPAVIFEWHPKLIEEAGNDPFRAFDALRTAKYTRFLWFNNNGTFSHFGGDCSSHLLERQRKYLMRVSPRTGEHFDVVALPEGSGLDEQELAALDFARRD